MIVGFGIIFLCGWFPTFTVYLPVLASLPFVIFLFLVVSFSFMPREVPLAFFCKAVLVVLKSLSFCLSVKFLISPSDLNESLARESILHCRFFPFITLYVSCHFLLTRRDFAEKLTDSLMGICCCSLVAFNIFSLFLSFHSLISTCLSMFLLGFILCGTLNILDLSECFLSHVREVFALLSLQIFYQAHFFLLLWSLLRMFAV